MLKFPPCIISENLLTEAIYTQHINNFFIIMLNTDCQANRIPIYMFLRKIVVTYLG
jgi:hypothetical protein